MLVNPLFKVNLRTFLHCTCLYTVVGAVPAGDQLPAPHAPLDPRLQAGHLVHRTGRVQVRTTVYMMYTGLYNCTLYKCLQLYRMYTYMYRLYLGTFINCT